VNEDTHRHLGTVVHGLADWNGKKLCELYGEDESTVAGGDLIVRLRPLDVKVYSTTRRFESSRRDGRNYVSTSDTK
jgi:hypothetical protein